MTTSNNFTVKEDAKYPNPYMEIPIEHIHSLTIDLLNEDFHVSTHEEDYILIKGSKLNSKDYQTSLSSDLFTFKRDDQHTIVNKPYGQGDTLEIYLPKKVFYRNIILNTKSGQGRLKEIDADTIKITTITADIHLQDIEASSFELQTVSGEVELYGLKASNATFQTTNADLELNHLNLKNALKIQTIEGDIDLENGYTQELFFTTESGDLDGKEFYPNTISFDSIEGDLTIKNKKQTHDIIVKSKQSIDGEIKIK